MRFCWHRRVRALICSRAFEERGRVFKACGRSALDSRRQAIRELANWLMVRRSFDIDWFMFAIAADLPLFGAMMVYSASAMFSLKETQASQYTYFYKQIGFTLLGLGGDVCRQPDRLPTLSKP